ncbi:hypothetical protein, partial [Zhongshania sp.]|uniref:hypothetical protein n=1 Tax=Zhongshania sp. TaxID=1971902 RepID=UPI003561BD7E
MTKLNITGFIGEIPGLIPRLLPGAAAQRAINTRLNDGGLSPVRQSFFEHAFSAPSLGYQSIYRHKGEWLAWESVVHAAPGPVADDRLYFTGDGKPKLRIDGKEMELALTTPALPLTTVLGGTETSDDITVRTYTYTLVTEYGEESEPAPASLPIDWRPGQTVTLSNFSTTMESVGRTAIQQRIYRSVTTAGGTAEFFLIAERAATTEPFLDNVPDENVAGLLPSADWQPPPDDLEGLITMPNGMMVAHRGKDVYFCEPYRPHAWPEIYILTVDYPVVGLGAFGTSLAIMTEGHPYIAAGAHPASMVQERLELNLPCINGRGIADMGYAVAYPSHDGLVMVTSGGANIATESVFTKQKWQELNIENTVAGQYDGRYFMAYQAIVDGEARAETVIIDLSGEQPFTIRTDEYPAAFFFDVTESSLFMLVGRNVFRWDTIGAPPKTQTWKSKQFVVAKPTNFGALYIEAEDALSASDQAAIDAEIAAIMAENQALLDLAGPDNGTVYWDISSQGIADKYTLSGGFSEV